MLQELYHLQVAHFGVEKDYIFKAPSFKNILLFIVFSFPYKHLYDIHINGLGIHPMEPSDIEPGNRSP